MKNCVQRTNMVFHFSDNIEKTLRWTNSVLKVYVPGSFSPAVINTVLNELGGRKGEFHLIIHSPAWREMKAETQYRDLVTGTEARVTQECYILAGFLWLALSFVTNPSQGWHHIVVYLSHQLVIKKVPALTCPQASLIEAIPLMRFYLLSYI